MTRPTDGQNIVVGLRRAWLNLDEAVNALDEGRVKGDLLHHLTDCLRWEGAHDLPVMEKTITIITRLAAQHQLKGEVPYWIERLRTLLNELLLVLAPGRLK